MKLADRVLLRSAHWSDPVIWHPLLITVYWVSQVQPSPESIRASLLRWLFGDFRGYLEDTALELVKFRLYLLLGQQLILELCDNCPQTGDVHLVSLMQSVFYIYQNCLYLPDTLLELFHPLSQLLTAVIIQLQLWQLLGRERKHLHRLHWLHRFGEVLVKVIGNVPDLVCDGLGWILVDAANLLLYSEPVVHDFLLQLFNSLLNPPLKRRILLFQSVYYLLNHPSALFSKPNNGLVYLAGHTGHLILDIQRHHP